MLINVTDGSCQEYCPLDPRETMGVFDPFDPFDAVKDKGEVRFAGKKAHEYTWKDVILKIITMQTTSLFVDDSDASNPVPLKLTSELTPFGLENLGTQTNTWQFWTPGTPAATKFDIKGVATCKQSAQCGSPDKQAHRARRGDLYTFYRYMEQ